MLPNTPQLTVPACVQCLGLMYLGSCCSLDIDMVPLPVDTSPVSYPHQEPPCAGTPAKCPLFGNQP